MTFALPLGLLALLAIPIIIILHLMRERHKRVTVPSLIHWRKIPYRRPDNRMQQLPLTLLLLLHIIAAGLLGIALAQPQIAGVVLDRAEQTVVIVDTSTSMATIEGSNTRFAQAQNRVRDLLRSMNNNDRLTVIVTSPSARIIAAGDQSDGALIEAALDELTPGGTRTNIADAITLAETALRSEQSGQIVVFTDSAVPTIPDRNVIAPVDWQTIGTAQPNRAIIAFASRETGGTLQVYARVANYAPSSFDAQLELYGDEERIETRNISIDANGETELTWNLPSGYGELRATLDGADGLRQDDQALLTVAPTRTINTLLVSDSPDVLQRALSVVSGVSIETVATMDYDETTEIQQRADLTIFDSFVPPEWPSNALLVVNPPESNALFEVLPSAPRPERRAFNQRGAILEGLSFEGINFANIRGISVPEWAETQLAIEDIPLILRGSEGTREVAIWTFDLTASNLSSRLTFPLLVSRTVRDLNATPLPPALEAGEELQLFPNSRTTEVEIIDPSGQVERVSSSTSLTVETLTQPGWYRIIEQGREGPLFDNRIAVNTGTALESDLQPQPAPTFSHTITQSDDTIQRRMADLWPWLVLAALIVLAFEWGYVLR